MEPEAAKWLSYFCIVVGVFMLIESITAGFVYFIVGVLLIFFVSEELHKAAHADGGHGH